MSDARYHSPPLHVKALDTRIRNIAQVTGANESRLRRVIANTVVAQVLPLPDAVKWANDLIAAARQAANEHDPGPQPETLGG